jgi:hypothetical protein
MRVKRGQAALVVFQNLPGGLCCDEQNLANNTQNDRGAPVHYSICRDRCLHNLLPDQQGDSNFNANP